MTFKLHPFKDSQIPTLTDFGDQTRLDSKSTLDLKKNITTTHCRSKSAGKSKIAYDLLKKIYNF
jgi:hypothetical protein